MNTYIYVSIYHLQPTESFHCESKLFQSCLLEKRKELHSFCYLPFETDVTNENICKTDKDGFETMEKLSRLSELCSQQCTLLDIEFVEEPQSYAAVSINEDFRNGLQQASRLRFGYYIHMPMIVKVVSQTNDYGFISYVAEFAGWAGIFVGLSLVTIVHLILSHVNMISTVEFNSKPLLIMLNILSLIPMIFLLYSCTHKFVERPLGDEVNFEATEINFDMTICSMKYYHAYTRGSGSLNSGKYVIFNNIIIVSSCKQY